MKFLCPATRCRKKNTKTREKREPERGARILVTDGSKGKASRCASEQRRHTIFGNLTEPRCRRALLLGRYLVGI